MRPEWVRIRCSWERKRERDAETTEIWNTHVTINNHLPCLCSCPREIIPVVLHSRQCNWRGERDATHKQSAGSPYADFSTWSLWTLHGPNSVSVRGRAGDTFPSKWKLSWTNERTIWELLRIGQSENVVFAFVLQLIFICRSRLNIKYKLNFDIRINSRFGSSRTHTRDEQMWWHRFEHTNRK